FDTQYPVQYTLLQSSLIRRSLLIETGAFSEDLRSSEDFLVSFRAALRGPLGAIPDVVTRLYRTTDLTGSSLDQDGKSGVDYFRARVMAFDEASEGAGAPLWSGL